MTVQKNRPEPSKIHLPALIAMALCLLFGPASAEPAGDQDMVKKSDRLTLGGLIDDVLERYPLYEELQARLDEAAQYDDKASSLFSNAASVELRYQTGQIGNNDNLREYEAGIALPLWRFGERKANRQVARGIELEANTFATQVRWELAGIIRAALWRIELTANRVAKSEKATEVSSDLLRGIERRVDLGTLPLSDLLQARQDKLNSEIRLSSARIEYANAIRAYEIITEQNLVPADIIEAPSANTEIDDRHPALAYSLAQLERATAEYRMQKEMATDNPSLLLGVRSERGGDDEDYEDSVGVAFSYPFGFGGHVNSERAAANVRAATVRAEHRNRLRELTLNAHESKQNLAGAEREYRLAQQKNELAQQLLQMSIRAFELGEINFFSFLLIKESSFEAEMEASEKEIQWRSAIAQYNQAVGALP